MKMLVLHVGDNRYVIDYLYVLRIVPSLILKTIPYAPHYIAGMLDLGGHPIPIVDFCYLVEQRPIQSSFHSRIILLENKAAKKELFINFIGLLAEQVIDIIDLQPSVFSQSSLHLYASYISGIYTDSKGIIQRIDVNRFFEFISTNLPSSPGIES